MPLVLPLVFAMACDKEEEPIEVVLGFLNPDLDQGIALKLTFPGVNAKTVYGNQVFGRDQG